MKKVLVSTILVAGLLFTNVYAEKKESLFVNVTTSANIKAPMALMFANKGLQRGLNMTILLNVEGVQLAIKNFETPVNAQNGKSTQDLLKMFIAKGGKVLVCPMCLDALGYDKSQLIEGVEMADADKTFGAIFSSDKVISY
jgi:predicted peroxiredoxin